MDDVMSGSSSVTSSSSRRSVRVRSKGRPNGWAPSSVREVLLRPLFRGVIVRNQTKKRDVWGRKHRSNRPSREHLTVDAPHLRIISDEMWVAVQARFAERRAGRSMADVAARWAIG